MSPRRFGASAIVVVVACITFAVTAQQQFAERPDTPRHLVLFGKGRTSACLIPSTRLPGRCVASHKCAAFARLAALYGESVLSNESKRAFVRALRCSDNGGHAGPMVCCPLRGDYKVPLQAPADSGESDFISDNQINGTGRDLLPGWNECGVQYENRIFGGDLLNLDEFPWMALLIYNKNIRRPVFGCGGVLISNRYVLTAAHCVTGDQFNRLKYVRLGEYNTDDDIDCIYQSDSNRDCAEAPINVAVADILVPRYDVLSYANDIALIRLVRSVPFSSFIKPICLPRTPNESGLVAGNNLTVAGWGHTDLFSQYYGTINSPIKLKLSIPVIDQEMCQKTYENRTRISENQVCAGGEYARDSCPGDSGSPLMYYDRLESKWVASGIVSFGLKMCGTKGVPGVYTRVDRYVDWIRRVMKP